MGNFLARRTGVLASILLALGPVVASGQVVAVPTDSVGGAYGVLEAVGFLVEGPDASSPACQASPASEPGNHRDFGDHVLQVRDRELGRDVFAFVSHLDADSDRCLVQDRIRIEIKGGPQGASVPELEHGYGDTTYYRWQFRLDEEFVGSSSFCHLFQNKAQGGPNGDFPVVTLTARAAVLELLQAPENDGASNVALATAPLDSLRGRWVEAYLRQVHRDDGALEFTLRDLLTGRLLMSYAGAGLDLWRETTGPGFINRPKWGIYRARAAGLRDETVRFASFCVSESAAAACPSLIAGSGLTPEAVTGALPRDGSTEVPTFMPLSWSPVAQATGYAVFLGSSPGDLTLVGTSAVPQLSVPLEHARSYAYRVDAVNDQGTAPGTVQAFTTLDAPDPSPWEIVRGHARPEREAPQWWTFNTNLAAAPGLDSVAAGGADAGDNAYCWFSGPKEDNNANYRWRYAQEDGEATTVVLRLRPLADESNLIYLEFYGLGWRQKLRLNRATVKFERTPGDPETAWPAGTWDGDSARTLRVTYAPEAGNLRTTLYLDEDPTPLASGLSDEEKDASYFELGRAGGTDYGNCLDFVAIDPTGAYTPGAGTELPGDLAGPLVSDSEVAPWGTGSLGVYPNPARARVWVRLPSGADPVGPLRYSILDALGRLVRSGHTDAGAPLTLGELPAGAYTLLVVAGDEARATARFVVAD